MIRQCEDVAVGVPCGLTGRMLRAVIMTYALVNY